MQTAAGVKGNAVSLYKMRKKTPSVISALSLAKQLQMNVRKGIAAQKFLTLMGGLRRTSVCADATETRSSNSPLDERFFARRTLIDRGMRGE